MTMDVQRAVLAYGYIKEASRQERIKGNFIYRLCPVDLGVRVEVCRFGVVSSRLVSWEELEVCRVNPLVEARRSITGEVAP